MIFTTSKQLDGTPTSGGKDYPRLGEGNDAYMNFVEDLTVEIGSGNPGAIGIDYLANNIGAVRDVTLRAPADSGAIGLSMMRKWPGPALVQRVTIEGNIFENCWTAAQTGVAIVLKLAEYNHSPWNVTQDVTFRNNIVRHSTNFS